MWFFLGVKFYGNIIFYIRGQHDVLKVKVIWESSTAMLPLFLDSAHTVAMIRHSMDVVKNAVEHVNPGQTPVCCVCCGKADSVEVAREVWRRQNGGDVWWAPHRDGRPEDARRLAPMKWLGTSLGAS